MSTTSTAPKTVQEATTGRAPATKDDVSDLLKRFTESPDESISDAKRVRKDLTAGLEDDVRDIAVRYADVLGNTTDVDAAAGALRSLKTVQERLTRVIIAVPDEKLGDLSPTPDVELEGFGSSLQ